MRTVLTIGSVVLSIALASCTSDPAARDAALATVAASMSRGMAAASTAYGQAAAANASSVYTPPVTCRTMSYGSYTKTTCY